MWAFANQLRGYSLECVCIPPTSNHSYFRQEGNSYGGLTNIIWILIFLMYWTFSFTFWLYKSKNKWRTRPLCFSVQAQLHTEQINATMIDRKMCKKKRLAVLRVCLLIVEHWKMCVCCVSVCGCMCVITHTLSPPLLAACTCGEWWVSYLRKAAFLKQLLDIQFLRILDPLDKLEETARYAMSGEGGKCTWPHPFCLPTPDSLHFSSSSDVTLLPTLQDWRFRTQIRHFYN